MSWIVSNRDLGLLALLALTSLCLCALSVKDRIEARRTKREALAMMVQVDSLMRDWIARGCAPRTKAVP